ncbi:tRNA-specific adenosine deaminase 3 [Nematocida ausubeli]|uniref:CMP/dCMP-type deaminase domain-containing protein n=1 Tax=Nematocida ausubeli (strain ATCC PRA-371 / ERTm2) TaxID=1913371 RepID=H8ZCG2_NEMA1|nr:uncharacterized protein NESG_02228 [Nematocida ausubeli]EHY65798.1 hypothetical protein NERG_01405 [Nematocida ausubeli]KAI5132050.1 tRNA-specific adenosine deaminase 3 [Nematocida ausubeli]KAI5132825.1 tRNA-specific adenosine deaminase 3 [Nematocida ausubeli]KAI5147140.1 tRNA-specific adenosine deaminase 3 [Nematocida ausubeli]KAI5160495.1 tRNA-specific adenosine deaminase 3 [Nematocida ausubeli]
MLCTRINPHPQLDLEKWLAVSVPKKNSSSLIREISKYFQNKPGFLKRIKPENDSLCVLLCKEADYLDSANSHKQFIESLGVDTETLFPAYIPIKEPKTEVEINAAIKQWPCSVKVGAPETTEVPHYIQRLVTTQSKKQEACAVSATILEDTEFSGSHAHTIFANTDTPDSFFQHSVIRMVKTISRSTSDYLCTGRTVILSSEPCLVCGMALVHGRVKRVYIAGIESPDGPYTKQSIHQNSALNHRIDVYMINGTP